MGIHFQRILQLQLKICIVILLQVASSVQAEEVCTLTNCQDSQNIKKTAMEKLKDERVLNYLNTLWKFHYERNSICLTADEKKRIEYYMRQIKYPYLSTEKMTSEQLRAVILKSADTLSFELEKELAHSCQKDTSLGFEKKILKNLEDLHAKVEQKIDSQPYWLWDQDEFKAAEARRNRIDIGHR